MIKSFSIYGGLIFRRFIYSCSGNFWLSILFIVSLNGIATLSGQELRGVWFARDSLGSKDAIARAMDSLADNNFNVVYVNCWSRGYPLWQSAVFSSHTGLTIDPAYAGRDILAECIAEGHRRGLYVEAWFEYGFVGGYSAYLPGTSGKGKIFDAHPDWVEKQQNGTEIDASSFYWMIHPKPEVQNFLVALCAEIARNYDVDGIELDRCRYSSLSYGYDTFTDSLYKAENGGSAPPASTSNSAWIQWRANKINAFIARAYDTIKTINPKLNVSNAPSQYSSTSYSAYSSFCQDWVWWVNNNKVDNVNVQMYVSSASTFGSYAGYIKSVLTDYTKAYPSYAFKPNNISLTNAELLALIDTSRARGYKGNGIWYYSQMFPYTALLKSTRYSSSSYPPYSTSDWRSYRDTVKISNTSDAVKTGSWSISASTGFSGSSYYASSGATAYIDYYANAPVDGWYEVYAYEVISSNRSTTAEHKVYDYSGVVTTVLVDQTVSANKGWYKLCDVYLLAGRRRVLSITNNGLISGKLVSADGAMILLNRRLSPTAGVLLPVELVSFNARAEKAQVLLQWHTASEVNNYGFEIERKSTESGWTKIAFVQGAGNSNSPKSYSYSDRVPETGDYFYRLKQIDSDGNFTMSPEAKVYADITPLNYALHQNYPNPFNNSTVIKFDLPEKAYVRLSIYNHLGENMYELGCADYEPGRHSLTWNTSDNASGIYFCRIKAGAYTAVRKLILIK